MINKGFLDSDYTPEGVEIHTALGDTGWTAHLGWDALAENSGTQDMDGLLMGQITGSVGGLKLGIGGLWIYNKEMLTQSAAASIAAISKDVAAMQSGAAEARLGGGAHEHLDVGDVHLSADVDGQHSVGCDDHLRRAAGHCCPDYHLDHLGHLLRQNILPGIKG